ncbi:MAG: FMN-binding glutamate synthase family protein [Betaproteobacteria bacterium TMED156]|nr:MAG: FMN-binding glutamate synthase family protein [Betaproteobacteria bacterium TMED156]
MKDIIWGRYSFLLYLSLAFLFSMIAGLFSNIIWIISAFFGILAGFAWKDYFQKKHGVIGNYPLLGRFRYMFESIRPELRQYFWEDDTEELPYSRNQRAMVYQRAKGELAARPFGSVNHMYEEDFSWLNHSMSPIHIKDKDFRITVGKGNNSYDISVLNISGTSFGALSPPAIQALNTGARIGNFAHNTGEGSISPYHIKGGGDLIWQVSTGYFGCRTKEGRFDPQKFSEKAQKTQVKMIEIKISQGAKPGHGGMLMAAKVTPEIAQTREIEAYKDCISPAFHSEFSTPNQLLDFVEKLRTFSGGKPIGIKMCIGHPWELIAIVKAMVESKKIIDFITVDGAEGGTGAAPVEFTDHIGSPLADGVVFVDNALIGAGLRDRVKIAASGKVVSAYDIVRLCALGADWVNMARPFMFSIGCIQARDCASSNCPTGIATMNSKRFRVIDVEQRSKRVLNFHKNTINAVAEMLESTAISHPVNLTRRHIVRRLSASQIRLEDQIYPKVNKGALLRNEKVEDPRLEVYWSRVSGESFNPIDEQSIENALEEEYEQIN